MSREYTNKLLEMVEEGLLNKDTVIVAFCNYMPEADVKDMMESEGFIEEEEDEEEEDLDDDDDEDGDLYDDDDNEEDEDC